MELMDLQGNNSSYFLLLQSFRFFQNQIDIAAFVLLFLGAILAFLWFNIHLQQDSGWGDWDNSDFVYLWLLLFS